MENSLLIVTIALSAIGITAFIIGAAIGNWRPWIMFLKLFDILSKFKFTK